MIFEHRVIKPTKIYRPHELKLGDVVDPIASNENLPNKSSVYVMGSLMSASEGNQLDEELQSLAADVYDIIKDIQDPEKPNTLEDLKVVFEEGVRMTRLNDVEDAYIVHITFTPTVPHCSLATLIGLCIRIKLERSLPYKHKVDIKITEGTHSTEDSINKQINDKERIAAAMENPNLKELVERCIAERDY